MALIIDVETTGLPLRGGLPYGSNPPYKQLNMYDSSRIVQITMMVCNENYEQIELKDYIVKTDGFVIKNSSFHGITNEISSTQGISFHLIAEELSSYLKQVSLIIAHNAHFDISIIKSELYRLGLTSIIDEIDSKDLVCSMKETKMLVRARNNYGIKDPSLSELYSFATNKNIENQHNSKYDVINLHEIVKTLYDKNMWCINYTLRFANTVYVPSCEKIPIDSNKDILDTSVIVNDVTDFSKLSLVELKKYCKNNGINGYSKMNKRTLVETINNSIINA
jgi:DNA polymerase III epsilon subunit-like protein